MELIDTSRLNYTKVCPVNEPNNECLAVLESDIKNAPVYSVSKSIGGIDVPIEPLHRVAEHGKMSVEDALIVFRTIKGLSATERDAADVLCDYVETQIEKRLMIM